VTEKKAKKNPPDDVAIRSEADILAALEDLRRGYKLPKPKPEPTDGDDSAWLRWLDGELNLWVPRTRRAYGFAKALRSITEPEWARVQAAVAKDKLVAVPHNAGMGFNFGLTLYDTPTYLGLPCEKLLTITGEHFDLRFAEAWEKLSPLSHNDDNAQRLSLYGFEPLRKRDHYDY